MPTKRKTGTDPVSLAISQNDARGVAATLTAAIIAVRGDTVLKDERGPAAAAATVFYDVLTELDLEHERRIKPVQGEVGDKYTLQTRDPSRSKYRRAST